MTAEVLQLVPLGSDAVADYKATSNQSSFKQRRRATTSEARIRVDVHAAILRSGAIHHRALRAGARGRARGRARKLEAAARRRGGGARRRRNALRRLVTRVALRAVVAEVVAARRGRCRARASGGSGREWGRTEAGGVRGIGGGVGGGGGLGTG
jgi:hypothetical protein